jgi:hypothetical protein
MNGFTKKGYRFDIVRSLNDCRDYDIIIYECKQDDDVPDVKVSGKVFVCTTTILTSLTVNSVPVNFRHPLVKMMGNIVMKWPHHTPFWSFGSFRRRHTPFDYINPKILEHASQLRGILTSGCNEGALSIYRKAGLAVVNMPGGIPLDDTQYYDKGMERRLESVFIGNVLHKPEQFEKFVVPFSREVECLFVTPPENKRVVSIARGEKRFESLEAGRVNELFNRSKLVPVIHWLGQPELNPRLITAVGSGALPISDNSNLVKQFYDGLVPCSDDPSEWISMAKHYLADEEDRRSLVKRLREICVERYSNVALVEKLEAA